MPRSKRNKVVPLSKVQKKNENISSKKADLASKIKNYLDEYEYCFVIKYKNMTNLPMQELRNYWKNSKFVFGKNKVLQLVMGKTEDDEYKLNTHKLAKFLKGSCGLIFSNDESDYVVEYIKIFNFSYFNNYSCPYFGNTGTVANQTYVIKAGQPKELEQFPSSMESQLRQLGLQIKLESGKYYLLSDYVVCEEGKGLTPEQSKMIVRYLYLFLETSRNPVRRI